MEFNFQTLRFNATEKLVEYVNKKVAKLEKNPDIQTVDLTLKVVKPEPPALQQIILQHRSAE